MFIAGGGINGAALARLTASQGKSVALAEASDFGAGASSNTSKLIHGGLRYLESADFNLVRDAVLERAHLLSLAPHLVREERFLFPLCETGRHSRLGVKAGMVLYDALAGSLRLRPHGYVPAVDLRGMEPEFLPQETVAAYAYSDCVMDDARLVLETVLDAQALGAQVWNYHRVTACEPNESGWDVTVEDRCTGKEKVFTARKVALTLGPWTDPVLNQWMGGSSSKVRLSQGSHLVVDGIPARSCFLLPVPHSRRYFFVVPFHETHLVGTTEVELTGDPGVDPVAKPVEKQELLELIRRYFPGANPRVITLFTGIRPLAASGGNTITLSREHVFHKVREGMFAAVGGKYTTHRVLARDFFCFIFGQKKKMVPLTDRRYPGAFGPEGADAVLRELRSMAAGPPEAWPRWVRTYGGRALDLARYVAADPIRSKLLRSGSLCAGEVGFSAEQEFCRTAVDFFRRRTGLYFTSSAGLEALEEVENLLAARNVGLGGGSVKLLGEEADYRTFLRHHEHCALA